MLNIPSEVKVLFSRDSVHKNFHVHFPNGESSDLTNDDVVSESVVFTESLCSQQYFKFGLAEASSVAFTAVNIPNVRGAVMQCAIEIDVSSLGATWITNHPVDSSLAFLEPQTVLLSGSYYYRVPYGEFVVDSCPRDHGAMFRRQITAYTEQTDTIMEPGGLILSAMVPYDKTFLPSVKSLVHGLIQSRGELLVTDGYSAASQRLIDISLAVDPEGNYQFELWDADQTEITARIEFHCRAKLAGANQTDRSGLYGLELGTMAEQMLDVYDAFRKLDEYGWQFYGPQAQASHRISDALLSIWVGRPTLSFNSVKTSNSVGHYFPFRDLPCFYPFRDGEMKFSVSVPVELEAYLCDASWNHLETVWSFDLSSDAASVNLVTYTDSNRRPGIALSIAPTLTEKEKLYVYAKQRELKLSTFSYTKAFSLPDLLQGYLEIMGEFLAPSRTGGQKLLSLSNSSPISIGADDWSEFWWDENEISPIGEIDVTYSDGKEEQTQTIVVDEGGGSVYDMSDNEVLRSAELTEAAVIQILTDNFMPKAAAVNFTPVDLEMRGLPYLEAGDAITMTAKDGTTVTSYILRQEISGIQNLQASVTSTNGELMEVEA